MAHVGAAFHLEVTRDLRTFVFTIEAAPQRR